MSKLREEFDAAIKNYIEIFEKKQGVEFCFAVSDDLLDVLCFGDYFFTINDIVFDVDNELEDGLIFSWQDDCVQHKQHINLMSYAKGLRHE